MNTGKTGRGACLVKRQSGAFHFTKKRTLMNKYEAITINFTQICSITPEKG